MQEKKDLSPFNLRDFKPLEDLNLLLSELKPYANFIHARKGQRYGSLDRGKPQCYLIVEGSVTVHRSYDNRVIGSALGPALLGVGNHIIPIDQTYIVPKHSMSIGMISLELLHSRLTADNLWQPFSKVLLFTISHLLQQNLNLVVPTSYEKIRTCILNLYNEPEDVKRNINAARYIQERTLLSRSHVMMIISKLKEGGYIEINRGVLKSLKSLPLKF